MKRVNIVTKDGQRCFSESGDPSAWIEKHVAADVWGKKERLVLHKSEPMASAYDEADVLEEIDAVLYPEIPAVMNDAGEVVQEAIPAVVKRHAKLRAEYTIEIVDITAEHALAQCIASRKAEYPTPEDFLNAYFDGDESALEQLRAARLIVKDKYPKP